MEYLPLVWSIDDKYYRVINRRDWNRNLDILRTKWMGRTSWQSLVKISAGNLFKPLKYFPPILIMLSYLLELFAVVGEKVQISLNFYDLGLVWILYMVVLGCIWAFCPAPVRAQLKHLHGDWHPVDRLDCLREMGHAALRDEVEKVSIRLDDLPHLTHLERSVLFAMFQQFGKVHPYCGLNLPGTELIREIAVAITGVRGGNVYESTDKGKNWCLVTGKTKLSWHSNVPTLYGCNIFRRKSYGISDFKENTDIGLYFYVAGRNMLPPGRGRMVENFVSGFDDVFEDRSIDRVLDILAKNASCKRPSIRIMLWSFLGVAAILLTFVSLSQLVLAVSRFQVGLIFPPL
jgi:hypothetical protein